MCINSTTASSVHGNRLCESATGLSVVLLPGVFVGNTACLLHLLHGSGGIDAVVISQVVKSDVFHGVDTFSGNGLVDAVTSAIDRVVLEFHDCSGAERIVGLQVTGESRYGGHNNNHFILLVISCSANNTLNNCGANLVGDGSLSVHGRGDEELVLYIDEVLAVLNDVDIGVRDGVL